MQQAEGDTTPESPGESSAALHLKELGNNAYRAGQLEDAIKYFRLVQPCVVIYCSDLNASAAIEIDPRSAVLYCNRSMARGAVSDWKGAAEDAVLASQIQPEHLKAHFWLVKSLVTCPPPVTS